MMSYLLVTSSLTDAESFCFGPVYTAARANHVTGYLKDVEAQFNLEKKLQGDYRVELVVKPVADESQPLFPDGDLRALGAAALALLRRQYRERYEEAQNV